MKTSVVIPTFNGAREIGRLLDALRAQQPRPPDEILAIDSGSRDDTCERVRAAGGRVIEWKEPFNHGLTRDAGIAASTGEIVLLTVQDAVPEGRDWLARIVAHFADGNVGGVSTRQIPPPDGPLELRIKAKLELEATPAPVRVSLSDHPNYATYTPAQRLELYRFDDVCSALRRSAWERIPFGPCRYAEDFVWARRALEAGYTLVRDPLAPVIHAHRRRFWYEFRRAVLDAWVLDEAFGYRYRLRDKLNRVARASQSNGDGGLRPTWGARMGAAKTYSAHVLGRGLYSTYRAFGVGHGAMNWLTRGI
jgi:rhamnosyltransferase